MKAARPARPALVRTPVRETRSPSRVPRWLRAILGVPLEQKVLGANLVVLTIAVALLISPLNGGHVRWADMSVLLAALTVGAMASYGLIRIALKPVKELEQIARKVSLGRVSERVPPSLVADPDLAHLAATMNEMLDNLATGRRRMAKLAADVVYAQETERAQVARDLHDSIGQTLAAASFQIAAAANEETVADVRTQLNPARELLRNSLEEIRNVSRSLHPRVADDLGLPTALQGLADLTRQRSLIDVRVETRLNGAPIPPALSSTFYRVAQEALRNIEMHADAGNALLSLSTRAGVVELEISDDGCGLDGALDKVKASPTLARMRQRLSLAGGELHIHSTPDCGTRVIARAKLDTEAGDVKAAGEGEAA
jgi:signal transduction histidine kinase